MKPDTFISKLDYFRQLSPQAFVSYTENLSTPVVEELTALLVHYIVDSRDDLYSIWTSKATDEFIKRFVAFYTDDLNGKDVVGMYYMLDKLLEDGVRFPSRNTLFIQKLVTTVLDTHAQLHSGTNVNFRHPAVRLMSEINSLCFTTGTHTSAVKKLAVLEDDTLLRHAPVLVAALRWTTLDQIDTHSRSADGKKSTKTLRTNERKALVGMLKRLPHEFAIKLDPQAATLLAA